MTEFEKMCQLLDMSWYLRDQIVPCLVGPPGIGKTAAVMQHAAEHDSKVVKIVASRCVPSETVGMTMPDNENHSMTIYNSMQLSSLRDGDILFLDELLEADQFVLSTMLTLIESREMADGTPLPDIQIIAATNDTISPDQLKGNIRQRFMFERFEVDHGQTQKYIYQRTGILLPTEALDALQSDGNDYNFMTPRSLTKLCLWFDATPEEKWDVLAALINVIWKSNIGSKIRNAAYERNHPVLSPEEQTRDAVTKILHEHHVSEDETFEDASMSDLLELLKGLPDWDTIREQLESMAVEEPSRRDSDEELAF
jgi:hypothetical protein